MASHTANMAATARAAEAGEAWVVPRPPAEPAPFLSGWRAVAAGTLVLGVAGLLLAPALLAAGSVVDAGAVGRAATWIERLAPAAPAVLTARALVALAAVVVIARSDDGRG